MSGVMKAKLSGAIVDEFEELYLASPMAMQVREHLLEVSSVSSSLLSPLARPIRQHNLPTADGKAKVLQLIRHKSTFPVPDLHKSHPLPSLPMETLERPPGEGFRSLQAHTGEFGTLVMSSQKNGEVDHVTSSHVASNSIQTPQEYVLRCSSPNQLSPKNLTPDFLDAMKRRSWTSPSPKKVNISNENILLESQQHTSDLKQLARSSSLAKTGREKMIRRSNYSQALRSNVNCNQISVDQDCHRAIHGQNTTQNESVPHDKDDSLVIVEPAPRQTLTKVLKSRANVASKYNKHGKGSDVDYQDNFSPRLTRMARRRKESLENVELGHEAEIDQETTEQMKPRKTKTESSKIKGRQEHSLSNWIIKCIKNEICVEGTKDDVPEDWSWHSTSIVKRKDAHTVVSSTETVYRLVGPMDVDRVQDLGFSKKFVKAFKNGFPANWKTVVKHHFDDLKGKTIKRRPMNPKQTTKGHKSLWTSFSHKTCEEDLMDITDLPTTKCGRRVKPQLAWWVGQRVVVYPRTNLVQIEQGTVPDASPVSTPNVFFKKDKRTEQLQEQANLQLLKQTQLNRSRQSSGECGTIVVDSPIDASNQPNRGRRLSSRQNKGAHHQLQPVEEKECLKANISQLEETKTNSRLFSQRCSDYDEDATPVLAKRRRIQSVNSDKLLHSEATGNNLHQRKSERMTFSTGVTNNLSNSNGLRTGEKNDDFEQDPYERVGGLRRSLTLQFRSDSVDQDSGSEDTDAETRGSDSGSTASKLFVPRKSDDKGLSNVPAKIDKTNSKKGCLHDNMLHNLLKRKQNLLSDHNYQNFQSPHVMLTNVVGNKALAATVKTTPVTTSVLAGKQYNGTTSKCGQKKLQHARANQTDLLVDDILCQSVHETPGKMHSNQATRKRRKVNVVSEDIEDDCLSQPSEEEIEIARKPKSSARGRKSQASKQQYSIERHKSSRKSSNRILSDTCSSEDVSDDNMNPESDNGGLNSVKLNSRRSQSVIGAKIGTGNNEDNVFNASEDVVEINGHSAKFQKTCSMSNTDTKATSQSKIMVKTKCKAKADSVMLKTNCRPERNISKSKRVDEDITAENMQKSRQRRNVAKPRYCDTGSEKESVEETQNDETETDDVTSANVPKRNSRLKKNVSKPQHFIKNGKTVDVQNFKSRPKRNVSKPQYCHAETVSSEKESEDDEKEADLAPKRPTRGRSKSNADKPQYCDTGNEKESDEETQGDETETDDVTSTQVPKRNSRFKKNVSKPQHVIAEGKTVDVQNFKSRPKRNVSKPQYCDGETVSSETQSEEEDLAPKSRKSRKQKSSRDKSTKIKHTKAKEDDVIEEEIPWEKGEILQLRKAINSIPPDRQFFWEAVASHVQNRNADQCRRQHHKEMPTLKKKPPKPKGKEKATSLDQLSGGKGTLKRKRQLREILDHHNEGHEDDFFDATPFKGSKCLKLPTIGEDSEDEFFSNRPDFQTPGSSRIFTPSAKFPWMPVSEKKTPSSHVTTPGLLKSVDRNAADLIMNRMKRGRHRPVAKSNNKKAPEMPESQQDTITIPDAYDDLFETQKVVEEDSEEEKDYYFSDED